MSKTQVQSGFLKGTLSLNKRVPFKHTTRPLSRTTCCASSPVYQDTPTLQKVQQSLFQSKDKSTQLTLNSIRNQLIRQEDTIIYSLIERSQYLHNELTYIQNAIPVPGFTNDGTRYSMVEYMLRETEAMHGRIRRYSSPVEHAFYPEDIPHCVIPPLEYPQVLAPYAKSINLNADIIQMYIQDLLPEITQSGDDGNYGSSGLCDVNALQAISKRIHFGKFVAEAKFQSNTEDYTDLIKRQDSAAILETLTNLEVEKKVIERVRFKATVLGQDLSDLVHDDLNIIYNQKHDWRVQPEVVAELYNRWVMPMTKQVQVMYLLKRLD